MMNTTNAKLFLLCCAVFSFQMLTAQTASVMEGCAPLEISFSPPDGAASFYWDFDNGATSTLSNPVNTYIQPGNYTVSFRPTPDDPVTGTIAIVVYEKPNLQIASDTTSGCRPLLVNFSDQTELPTGISITDYEWVFGDGGISNGTSTPAHLYTTSGNFTVSLAVETNLPSCNVTKIFPDLIQVTSVNNVGFITIPNPARACEPPLNVTFLSFTSSNGLTFDWDFGNGNTFTGVNPPQQLYTTDGEFPVTLTARDTNGCFNTAMQTVDIGKLTASFEIPDTVCIRDSIFITNTSDPGTYFWEFSEGASINTTSVEHPALIFTQAGWVDIHLTVMPPDSICPGDTTITVYVDEADASFTAAPNYSCSNPLIVNYTPLSTLTSEWLWLFHDLNFSTEQFPTDTLAYEDLSEYGEKGPKHFFTQLIATNPSGCRDTVFRADTIYQPNAWFMPDKIDGCAPLTVLFADSSSSREPITSWTYVFGDGTSQTLTSYDEPIEHIFTAPGEYDVQLFIENAGGCADTSYTITIEVGAPLPLDFAVDQSEVCPGDEVLLTSLLDDPRIDAWHFATEGDRSSHCYLNDKLQWAFTADTGPQAVTLTVAYNGCQSTLTKENLIQVKGPIAQLDYEMDCSASNDFIFRDSSLSATFVQWNFGDGETSTANNPIHSYEQTGDYTVILTAENDTSGCPISRDTMTIHVRNPQAIFDLPLNACKGEVLTLNGASSIDVNADCWKGYEWFFAKNNRPITTQDTSVFVRFSKPGRDTVSLVVEDINGCKDTLTQLIDIREIEAAFDASTYFICPDVDHPISFTDFTQADTSIASWSWNFGDGDTSNLQNPVHLFEGFSDSYLVTLEVTDALGCKGFAQDTIAIYQPTTTIVTQPIVPNICLGQTLNISAPDFTDAGSFLLFNWDFGNGDQSTTQSNEVVYDTAGTYQVRLTYEEASSGCGGTLTRLVNVQSYPEAAFSSSVDSLPVICYPANISFMDQSESDFNLTYTWDFGNGQSAAGPTPAASFDKGTFDIRLVASTSYGCRDTAYSQITLIGPEGNFSIDPNGICLGESVTLTLQDTIDVDAYTWNFGDGQQESDVNPVTHTYDFVPPSGQTVVTLILEGANGACTYAVENPLTIAAVNADFQIENSLDSIFCSGPLQFNNQSIGGDLFHWNFDNGNTSEELNPAETFSAGTYNIQLAIENSTLGCQDTLIKQISVIDNPIINILPDTLCPGDTIQLRLESPFENATYVWEPANLVEDNNASNPLAFPATTTEFSVTVTNANGCEGVGNQQIDVITPFSGIPTDTLICEGDTLLLNLPEDGFHFFSWTPSGPPFAPEDDQIYQLQVTDVLGCREDLFELALTVVGDKFDIPNVFTPNGDAINDIFKVYSEVDPAREDLMQILDFKVYNRWGNLVYEGSGPAAAWDGTYQGVPAPSEVYIYAITIYFPKYGRSFVETGDVTLMR